MNFPDVKILIWDFDGTLYRSNPDLHHAIREAEYRTIVEKKHVSREEAVTEFAKYFPGVTPSATQAVAKICGISTPEAAIYMESFFDRTKYLSKDDRLISLFNGLNNFTHYILANGVRRNIENTLATLGLEKNIFADVVTSELSTENKPSDVGFRYIMNKTGLPAPAHMMIGDREAVDLVPAKALGMHTCLVWSENKSAIADVTVSDVYKVVEVL